MERYRALLALAAALREVPRERFEAALAALAGFEPRPLPVRGADLLALGLRPGPRVGEVLRELEALWLGSDFRLSREELLAAARRRIARTDARG